MFQLRFLIAKCLLIALILPCSVTAIQLDWNFHVLTPFLIGSRYACNANVINTGSSSVENIKVRQSGKSNDDVRMLDISYHHYLTSVPKRIGGFFKNVDALSFTESLRSINANDLLRHFLSESFVCLQYEKYFTQTFKTMFREKKLSQAKNQFS